VDNPPLRLVLNQVLAARSLLVPSRDETEELLWYCDRCEAEPHRVRMRVFIEVQLSEDPEVQCVDILRTCKRCGFVTPERAPTSRFNPGLRGPANGR
jgi:hypothetical protein